MHKQRKLFVTAFLTLVLVATSVAPALASTYQVQPGDSLFLIAQRHGTTVEALRQANNVWTDMIYPGDTFVIPDKVHTIQWGESLWIIANKYGVTVAELQEANGISGTLILAGQQLTIPGTSSGTAAAPANPTTESSTPRTTAPASNVSQGDLDLIARMITAEAEGEPYTGKVAVAAVILNRVRDPRFPNTVSGVLFAPWEFEPVMNNRFWQISPTAEDYAAAQDAINGWDPTGGAVFFYNPVKATSTWIFSRQVITRIGQHVFAI